MREHPHELFYNNSHRKSKIEQNINVCMCFAHKQQPNFKYVSSSHNTAIHKDNGKVNLLFSYLNIIDDDTKSQWAVYTSS